MCIFARLSLVSLLLCISTASELSARPIIIHEQERIELPDPYYRPLDVCLIGDDLLVLTTRENIVDPDYPYHAAWTVILLQRQSEGEWLFIQELAAATFDSLSNDIWQDPELACDGPLAGFSTPDDDAGGGNSFILERTSSGWVATALGHVASETTVYGDSVAFAGQWGSPTSVAVYRKDPSGAWSDVRYAVGNPGDRSDFPEIDGPDSIGLADDELVATGDDYRPEDNPEEAVFDLQVFDLVAGEWHLTATLPWVPSRPRARPVGVVGDRVALLMDVWTEPGDVGSFFTRDATGAWTVKHTLLSEEFPDLGKLVIEGDRAIVGGFAFTEIPVFQEEARRRYRHEATLVPFDNRPSSYASDFSVDGEWVAASMGPSVYLFHVPSTLPAPHVQEETFEDNMAQGWSVWGNSADWRIVSANGSRFYRQRNMQAGSRSILETFDGTDQSIQADVRIKSGVGPTWWSGFVVRYADENNFYYLLVNGQSVQIRRMVNGAYGPIATAPFNLVLGRTYRFRLEAIGKHIRAFVDGEMVAEAVDDAHAQGKAGLAMWRTVTEYDNVVVTSSPQTELISAPFGREGLIPWSSTPSSAWSHERISDDRDVYRQARVTGSAHAVHGAFSGDQIVTTTFEVREFNASGRGSVGVILRYIDNRNFYYARLTDANKVVLGMQIDGSHRTIDTGTLNVNPNTTYTVRAEAIGSSLRAYVNGTLIAEGQDNAFPEGRYGLVTFEAAADFDSFDVIRP